MSKPRRWTEDEEAYLEYYVYDESNSNLKEASKFLGRSLPNLSMKLTKMRRQGNPNVGFMRRNYTDKEINFIKDNYHKMTSEKIGERLGRSGATISVKARSLGLTNKQRLLKNYDDEIRKLAKGGYTITEIAKELDFTYPPVHRYIKKNNIKCQPGKMGRPKRKGSTRSGYYHY